MTESRRFLLLTELDEGAGGKLLDFADRTLAQIRDRLQDAARQPES